jgi:thiamine-triphosphatase
MIEVERKFLLEGKDEADLVHGAIFLNEKKFTDSYYDTKDLRITTRDWWLRERDGRWELKIAITSRTRLIDHYDEVNEESTILAKLGLPAGEIGKVLQEHGYQPFCTFTTTRRKFQKGPFIIDLDQTDYGYQIVEVEYMVESKKEIPKAVREILALAKEYGLKSGYVRGKVIEYLRRNDPRHLEALIKAGVVKAIPSA